MTPQGFLEFVWPRLKQGEYYGVCWIVRDEEGKEKHFRWCYCKSLEQAVDVATEQSERGHCVYYCLCSLTQPHKAQKHFAAIKEFAFDLDVGKKDGYTTLNEAMRAISNYCHVNRLPLPYLLETGGGLHGHWALSQEIDLNTFKLFINGFRQTAKDFGLKVDFATVGSASQILRVEGTYNYKRGEPFKVHGDTWPETYGLERFEEWRQVGEQLQKDYERRAKEIKGTGDVERMASLCPAAKLLVKDGMRHEHYETWRGIASNVALLKGGDEWFHANSAKSDTYNPERTQQKLDDSRIWIDEGGGPVTCERIAQFCTACKDCPHFLKGLKAPVVLGRIDPEELKAPEAQAEPGADDTTMFKGKPIISRQVEPIGYLSVYGMRERYVLLKIVQDAERFALPVDDFLDLKRARLHFWNEHALSIFGTAKEWEAYATTALSLISRKPLGEIRMEMGWNIDFSEVQHGLFQINRSGIKYVPPIDAICPLAKQVRPRGDSTSDSWYKDEAWIREGAGHQCEALQLFFEKDTPHQAVAVLFPLTQFFWPVVENNQGGVVLSLYGDEGGTGKTTAMQAGLSVFGPWAPFMLQNNASSVQQQEKLSVLRNYPAGIDEAYRTDPLALAQWLQVFTTGRPKERLNRAGHMQMREASWRLGVICTANKSARGLLESQPDMAAMLSRMIELRFDKLIKFNPQIQRRLEENAGFLGPLFLLCVLRDGGVQPIYERAMALYQQHINGGDFNHGLRFKMLHLSLMHAIAELLVAYGFLHFDVEGLMAWYKQAILEDASNGENDDPVKATEEFIFMVNQNINVEGSGFRVQMGRVILVEEPEHNRWAVGYRQWAEYMTKRHFNVREALQKMFKQGRVEFDRPVSHQINIKQASPLSVDCIFFKKKAPA